MGYGLYLGDENNKVNLFRTDNYGTNWTKIKEFEDKNSQYDIAYDISNDGNNIIISYYSFDPNVTPPEEMRLNVCMSIADDVEVEGEIQKTVMPGGEYALMNVELEKPEQYGEAWMELVNWVQSNGYKIDISQPSYEIYKNNPEEHPEKHHILDMCMAVKK